MSLTDESIYGKEVKSSHQLNDVGLKFAWEVANMVYSDLPSDHKITICDHAYELVKRPVDRAMIDGLTNVEPEVTTVPMVKDWVIRDRKLWRFRGAYDKPSNTLYLRSCEYRGDVHEDEPEGLVKTKEVKMKPRLMDLIQEERTNWL